MSGVGFWRAAVILLAVAPFAYYLVAIFAAWPTHGLSLLLLLGYALLAWRVFRHRRRRGDAPADARLYAAFNVLGKFAEAVGLLKFFWNRANGSFRIIEYK